MGNVANPSPRVQHSISPVASVSYPSVMVEAANEALEALLDVFQDLANRGVPTCADELHELERTIHIRVAQSCVDPIVGSFIVAAQEDPFVMERMETIIDGVEDLRPQRSSQSVSISLLGGTEVTLSTPYYLRRQRKRPGRKRGVGRRMKEGNGLYPFLASLGIHHRTTPGLASEIARQFAQGSLEQSRQNLAQRGIHLQEKVISSVAQKVAKRGLSYREWKQEQTHNGYRGSGKVTGSRLFIGTDGGRIRVRTPKSRGRKRASGRNGFDAEWREPKLLVVHELDEHGRKIAGGEIRYDATLQDADGLFDLLVSTLCEIGAHEAKEWVVCGDGAAWIWDRVDSLVERVGYDHRNVTKVVDFYHAVEHLSLAAATRKTWSDKERLSWVKKMRRLLLAGKVDEVTDRIQGLCRGRLSSAMKKQFNYFEKRKDMMAYDEFKQRGIPLGSGSVESGIRRVINLRMKGNGIFWREHNAEGLLHVRAQLLSGRWDRFIAEVLEHDVLWTIN